MTGRDRREVIAHRDYLRARVYLDCDSSVPAVECAALLQVGVTGEATADERD